MGLLQLFLLFALGSVSSAFWDVLSELEQKTVQPRRSVNDRGMRPCTAVERVRRALPVDPHRTLVRSKFINLPYET
jgi:hypothetical protein